MPGALDQQGQCWTVELPICTMALARHVNSVFTPIRNELHLAVMVIPSSRSYSREDISETGFSFRLYQSPAAQLQILPE